MDLPTPKRRKIVDLHMSLEDTDNSEGLQAPNLPCRSAVMPKLSLFTRQPRPSWTTAATTQPSPTQPFPMPSPLPLPHSPPAITRPLPPADSEAMFPSLSPPFLSPIELKGLEPMEVEHQAIASEDGTNFSPLLSSEESSEEDTDQYNGLKQITQLQVQSSDDHKVLSLRAKGTAVHIRQALPFTLPHVPPAIPGSHYFECTMASIPWGDLLEGEDYVGVLLDIPWHLFPDPLKLVVR